MDSTHPVTRRALEVVQDLTSSLHSWIKLLPGTIDRPADLERVLGIDNPLAWRFFRVATAPTAPEAVGHLPTINQLRRVVQRGEGIVPPDAGKAALAAIQRFEDAARELGGDQGRFESLLSSLSPSGVARVERQFRRAAYKANAHLWGVQARTSAAMMVFLPREGKPESLRPLLIRGWTDISPTLPVMQLEIGERTGPRGGGSEAQDPPRLITEFSTVREVSTVESEEQPGVRSQVVKFRSVGLAGMETLFLLQHGRPISAGELDLRVLTLVPSEWYHIDLVTPPGYCEFDSAVLQSFARREAPLTVTSGREGDRKPLYETIETFHDVHEMPETDLVPSWSELFGAMTREHGLPAERFDIYRARITFPMMHAMIALTVKRCGSR